MRDERLDKMSLEEKCSLLSGESFYYSQNLGRLGIDRMLFTDGPHGLRKQTDKVDHLGMNVSVPATCFPPACALGSSWDEELIFKMGQALGVECKAENVSVILGPGMNIKRSPLCGRNFEYFSEDPYLSSHLAAKHIEGVQSKGVGTSVKHYAVNNQETRRLTLNAAVDERTLREIYLANFEYAVKTARPWTVMCAYNRLNGVFGSENEYLLKKILRDEWQYEGLTVTDWGAANDRVEGLKAGMDLEMPSSGGVNDRKVEKAVKEGRLPVSYVDAAVSRLLQLLDKVKEYPKTEPFIPEKHHKLAREIAADCIVLLKNERKVLPLHTEEKIGIVGEFAVKARFQGGGSSHINPTFTDNLLEEMRKIGGNRVFYTKGFEVNAETLSKELLEEAIAVASSVDKLVICAGLPETYETEGMDRTHLNLPGAQTELIEILSQYNKNLIVVLNNGAPVAMPFEGKAQAIVEGYLLGQAGGGAMADILYGKVNPSGKLAETFPVRLEDTPSYLNFPGEGYEVEYREGIFVGYRYYEARRIKPLFCFGHGLSYSNFAYEAIQVSEKKITDQDKLLVKVKVRNTSELFGKEVVQLYVQDHQREIMRPIKELKGFCKLTLEPGECKEAVFELDKRSFAYYNVEQKDFLVQSGEFSILVGASSEDIRLKETVEVRSTAAIKKWFHRNSTFGEMYEYMPARKIAEEEIEYFKRESGIDFDLGERDEDFAFRVICDFPLKTLVTFTEGRFSEEELDNLLDRLNKLEPNRREE